MGSSKALVSNFIFYLHKSSTQLLQNHRIAGDWKNFWSFVSPIRPSCFQQSTSPLWVTCHSGQELSKSCQVTKGASCTCSSWSRGQQQMPTAMSPVVLCSLVTAQNLSDGSSSSPRHRSTHSSWPTWRTTLPPCILCLLSKEPVSIHSTPDGYMMYPTISPWPGQDHSLQLHTELQSTHPPPMGVPVYSRFGMAIWSPAAEKPVHCPRLCMHKNLWECKPHASSLKQAKPFKG